MLMQVPNDTRYARFLHDKFIQLDGNLLIPLNTGLRSAAIGVGCLHHIDFKQFNMLVHAKVPIQRVMP